MYLERSIFIFYSSTLETEATCSPETPIDFEVLHSVIYQMIELFIPTAVRTSNPKEFSRKITFMLLNCGGSRTVRYFIRIKLITSVVIND